jgi:flagellar L-ring protein precursor FlgH
MITLRSFLVQSGLCAAATLAGCAGVPEAAKVDFSTAPPTPAYPQMAAHSNPGGLFEPASYRAKFEDWRARQVGDIVTINIVENIAASQKTTSATKRNSTISGGITAVPGFVFPGTSAENQLQIGGTSAVNFAGQGDNEAANTFSGSITATVTELLPNGYLQVTGEKQIGLNHNVDVLRFTGTVDPRAILPGNVVNSTSVANVRVESKGRGPNQEAHAVGWLTRFFMNISPF